MAFEISENDKKVVEAALKQLDMIAATYKRCPSTRVLNKAGLTWREGTVLYGLYLVEGGTTEQIGFACGLSAPTVLSYLLLLKRNEYCTRFYECVDGPAHWRLSDAGLSVASKITDDICALDKAYKAADYAVESVGLSFNTARLLMHLCIVGQSSAFNACSALGLPLTTVREAKNKLVRAKLLDCRKSKETGNTLLMSANEAGCELALRAAAALATNLGEVERG